LVVKNMPRVAVAVMPIPMLSAEEKALLLAVGIAGELEFSAVLKKDHSIVDMMLYLEQQGLVVIRPRHYEKYSDLRDFEQVASLSPLGHRIVGALEEMLMAAMTPPMSLHEKNNLTRGMWQ
jgi:hypothetical protein